VVGTLLGAINYGDRILFVGDMQAVDWSKLAITYCVPYAVATYGAVRYAMRRAGRDDAAVSAGGAVAHAMDDAGADQQASPSR